MVIRWPGKRVFRLKQGSGTIKIRPWYTRPHRRYHNLFTPNYAFRQCPVGQCTRRYTPGVLALLGTICASDLTLPGNHYNAVIMGAIASQITSLTIVYSTVYWRRRSKKHQSSASLAFVCGIHRGPMNSPHKRPVRRNMSPFDDVIMISCLNSKRVWYI